MIGRTLSHYRVTAALGAGGMGEVYRATDTTLGRDVALKVLPDDFASDPERLARFEREAKLLASLNHPNVAHVYGFESAPLEDGSTAHFLAMELVEGEDIAERLKRGPIPVDEALEVARQIADGLEEAHEKGIVHRDLKPANVKLAPDGKVKVLDFGLAKAYAGDPASASSADLSRSPTLAHTGTRAGVILGTAAYMSPEQARGKPLDKRADIWAYGVVLWEMLTGRPLFPGETVSDVLAAVLTREPDWGALPEATPPAIRRLLRRALERDPRRRLRDIGDARLEIAAAEASEGASPAAASVEGAGRSTGGRARLVWMGAALLAVLASALAAWVLKPSPHRPSWKLTLAPPPGITGPRLSPRISPDGGAIAYLSDGRLWVQDLRQLTPRAVPNGENATHLTWSPDGGSLAFTVRTQLWRSVRDGDTTLVAELPEALGSGGGIAWTAADTLVYTTGDSGLMGVPSSGGVPHSLLEPERPAEADFHTPLALPEGRGVAFVVHREPQGRDTIALYAQGQRRTVFQESGADFDRMAWSPSGHLLFGRHAAVWALPLRAADLTADGEPFMVAATASEPTVSREGALLLSNLSRVGNHQLAFVDRDGQLLSTVGEPVYHADNASLSPDGRHLAACIVEGDAGSIWVLDLERRSRSRLWSNVSCGGQRSAITWSSAGERVAFANLFDGSIRIRRTDGSDAETTLTEGLQPEMSHDGRHLVFARETEETSRDLWTLTLDGQAAPVPFLETPATEGQPALSPDGRHLAYVSDETGRGEVYLRPFPSGPGKWQVSFEGGDFPRWSPAGDRLYFLQDDIVVLEVEVESADGLTLSNPRTLFSGAGSGLDPGHGYDVSADGTRFVMVQLGAGEAGGGDLTLITAWPDEAISR